ncbi:hypothetical protein K440DRAFT_110714 [Wilcoxina mikolae CBS 423.85]|nr:hypothetical protein K440DRAFT_110714 [Wilcoxina mikolae CBS 423.85]
MMIACSLTWLLVHRISNSVVFLGVHFWNAWFNIGRLRYRDVCVRTLRYNQQSSRHRYHPAIHSQHQKTPQEASERQTVRLRQRSRIKRGHISSRPQAKRLQRPNAETNSEI